ncbi:MAG TPA: bifunctional diaminohydroxyphosphoribosylaminopyrimidine deaminase/5-amino-6-(5-phosphoribosylamino)uracil reductase RibD [Chitinophagaceae bacterium]|nr:bifunctional diaminohydroxyphosphoribosylaminopyrimidine deaminase/5-amino-6-(5-phosphoribosylamino)uracil reductase RibD [Chitinophagaceae bacterium]
MTSDEQYMYRCLQLAQLGAGYVAPNPMVGAVLVYRDRIIGEGYHQKYGEAHAEVNCIGQAASSGHAALIDQSTLYVSLEPCSHFGKTPPCADLIIRHRIPRVVIGCRDPFREVNGRGIEKLKAAGVQVELGVLEENCKQLNKRFFTFHIDHMPYIILKWAETSDGYLASLPPKGGILENPITRRLFISNEFTNRMVHKWRSEEAAILVGTNTVEYDNPELTTRLWHGPSPIRLVVDMDLRLPDSLNVFNGQVKTIIFNRIRHEEGENLLYYQLSEDASLVHQIVNALYQLKIQSVMIEGGARLLQSFIDEDMWDEARVISNGQLAIGKGLKAPKLENFVRNEGQTLLSDTISVYSKKLVS